MWGRHASTLATVLLLVFAIFAFFAAVRILRAVRVPPGPFPRCRRCGYEVGRLQLPTKCPECAQELSQATVFTAKDAAARIPNRADVVSCVLVLGIVCWVLVAGLFRANWPTRAMRASGSTTYAPGGGIERVRTIQIAHELEYIVGKPAHEGTLTVKIRGEDGTERAYSVGPGGKVVAADQTTGIATGSMLDESAARALYRAAGYDVDSDPLLSAEADLVLAEVTELLDDPAGRSARNPWRSVLVGTKKVGIIELGSSNVSQTNIGRVIRLGSAFVRVESAPVVVVSIATLVTVGVVLRRRSRVVQRLALYHA